MTRLPETEISASDLATPSCPHFEECGSCQLQHVAEGKYRAWKEDQVKNLFSSNGLYPENWEEPFFVGERTRRRVTFKFLRTTEKTVFGFNKFHSHDIAEINSCCVLAPRLENLIGILPEAIAQIIPKGETVDVSIQEADNGFLDCVITGVSETTARQTGQVARLAEACDFARVSFKKDAFASPVTQVSLSEIRKTNGLLNVVLPAGAFLQPSREGESALVDAVMEAFGPFKFGKKDKVADLFSGCGTFAGRLLEKYTVHAVEGDRNMEEALRESGKGYARFSAECRDLFKEPVTARELRDYKAVIFDPPRAGASDQCRKLAKSGVPLIVGVSCNPATFTRDAKILLEGGYTLSSVRILDQFTWSTHVELVGVFSRK